MLQATHCAALQQTYSLIARGPAYFISVLEIGGALASVRVQPQNNVTVP